MALNIRTNMASVTTQKNLASTSGSLQSSYERLSSGLRINHARDDAAGLAIAESLKADARIATVAMRNANDGISIISIADGAVGQITNVLSRLAELAEQSANGVYSVDQRSALQLEFTALLSEIERIAYTTEFNGLNLLSTGATVTFQVGFDGKSTSQIQYNGVGATLQKLGLAKEGSSVHAYSIMGTTSDACQTAARYALDAIQVAIDSVTRSRGILGAAESRLDLTIQNLMVAKENFTAAESRIRDVDVAEEAAKLATNNILQQAGTAVLAQANQQPELALQLLR